MIFALGWRKRAVVRSAYRQNIGAAITDQKCPAVLRLGAGDSAGSLQGIAQTSIARTLISRKSSKRALS